MRIKKDLAELSGARFSCEHASTAIELPEGQSDLLKIKVTVSMTCGAYAGGHFPFMIDVPTTYPFHAPSVTSISRCVLRHGMEQIRTVRVTTRVCAHTVFGIRTLSFSLEKFCTRSLRRTGGLC